MEEVRDFGFVVLDTETTGLPEENPVHAPYEIAWKIVTLHGDGAVCPFPTFSTYVECPINAMIAVSDYTKNTDNWKDYVASTITPPSSREVFTQLVDEVQRRKLYCVAPETKMPFYLVGANPGFDRQFLVRWSKQYFIPLPLRHRMWDTDNIAAVRLGSPEPLGLEESIRRLLNQEDFVQSHTAEDDVERSYSIFYEGVIKPWRYAIRFNSSKGE